MSPSNSGRSDVGGRHLTFGRVRVGAGTVIGPFTTIGRPYRKVKGRREPARSVTSIGRNCEIGSHVTILKGARISDNVSIDDFTTVEQDVDIGHGTILTYHAIVCNGAKIGARAKVGGFIGERSVVGDDCRVFGRLVHKQDDPAAGWDELDELAPKLGHHVFVAFGAVVAGGIKIGTRSYVCAGAVVTRDVPPRNIVTGVNQSVHYKSSKLQGLAKSRWFSEGDNA